MKTDGRTDGLAPFYVDPANGALSGGILTLGARGDSYYEYMLKQWLLSGKQQQSFLRCGTAFLPSTLQCPVLPAPPWGCKGTRSHQTAGLASN